MNLNCEGWEGASPVPYESGSTSPKEAGELVARDNRGNTADFLIPFVIPVLVLDSVSDAVPIAQTLLKGGIKAIEITLRTPVALDCIKEIKQACPELIMGAGTLVSEADVERVAKVGVDFAVSPGMTQALVNRFNRVRA